MKMLANKYPTQREKNGKFILIAVLTICLLAVGTIIQLWL